MIKKLTVGTISFLIGVGIAFTTEGFLRLFIQNIYLFSTSNAIEFVGKDFYIFMHFAYYIIFGFVFTIFVLDNIGKNLTGLLKNFTFCLPIFVIMVIIISAIDANLKIVECTACQNGIRKLHWNEIAYELIIISSMIISIIPTLIKILRGGIKDRNN